MAIATKFSGVRITDVAVEPRANPVEYPKSVLVAYVNHGTPDEYLLVGKNPEDVIGPDTTTKVARYVLAGTGVIQHCAPQYFEHKSGT